MKLYVAGPQKLENYGKLTAALAGSGIDVVAADGGFDFVLPLFDPIAIEAAQTAAANGKYFPDVGFITKDGLEAKCVQSGLAVLPTKALSADNLRSCGFPYFIIKPKLWSGSKHKLPYVYRVFPASDVESVIAMFGEESLDQFIIQKALIDPATQETYLLFVDGTVNGSGTVHFNSIAEKWMLNSSSADSHITHKAGIREVSSEDKYGFKAKVAKLLADNNIRNTPFKAQAIVDVAANTCYLNDWAWGVMPYTHLNILPSEYLVDHLKFAYDLIPSVTKPIDKVIVMHHIAFPKGVWDLTADQFKQQYVPMAQSCGVKLAEPAQQHNMGAVKPTESDYYVLFGVACDSVEAGKACLEEFQRKVSS